MATTGEAVAALIRKRSGLKQRVTKFKTYLEIVAVNELTPDTIFNLESRLTRITKVYDDFHGIQTEIMSICTDQAAHEVATDDFEDAFFLAIARAKSLISETRSNVNQAQVTLPKIHLPKFSGQFDKWIEFRDTYVSLIHNNLALSSIQKYHYLRGTLDGDAAQVIACVALSAESYERAWKLITERYDSPKILLNNHLRALFAIPAIQKESARALRMTADAISTHIEAIRSLKIPVDKWDAIVIFLMQTKLDGSTAREWENATKDNDQPTQEQFLKLLRDRANLVEGLELRRSERSSNTVNKFVNNSNSQHNTNVGNSHWQPRTMAVTQQFSRKCYICNDAHFTSQCQRFLSMDMQERHETIKRLNLCNNCLRRGHARADCRSSHCRLCNARHHTLLHRAPQHQEQQQQQPHQNYTQPREAYQHGNGSERISAAASTNTAHGHAESILLATALVEVRDANNKIHIVRALLDAASQANLISEALVTKLNLNVTRADITMKGVFGLCTKVQRQCNLVVKSRISNYYINTTCYISSSVTEDLPNHYVNRNLLSIPTHVKLADPHFDISGPIDLLIGAGHFWDIITSKKIYLGPSKPILHSSKLGWTVSGPIANTQSNLTVNLSTLDVQEQLKTFWELENYSLKRPLVGTDRVCETHFAETVKRNSHGRFIVSIPLKKDISSLGESYALARNRFFSLERKLIRNPSLYQQYRDFISEYISLEHMRLATDTDDVTYYLPHHAVTNENSSTTKLRVVFDAYAKTSSGLSVNDIQHTGPVLQDDLVSILLRFRKHRFVLSADIQKMYRQILITEKQRNLQRILWRSAPTDTLRAYTLNTVTYGTASASFLAIRCLHELANIHETTNPEIANIIRNDFYVDDLLTGADTTEDALRIANLIARFLDEAGMPLHKWISNSHEVMHALTHETLSTKTLILGDEVQTKILGLTWNPSLDTLCYQTSVLTHGIGKLTKRKILSLIATIFDPLGLIAPGLIQLKILLQKVWLLKLDWDDSVPENIAKTFFSVYNYLHLVNTIAIPRHIVLVAYNDIQLHGFCDASELAYGACVYVVSRQHDTVCSRLLLAKTKVAPLKTITIPRLELCAAVLLSRLIEKIRNSRHLNINTYTMWTDSTVVLGWLNMQPALLKTFVSHRTAEIQTLTERAIWRHTPTNENPADLLSRGIKITDLVKNNTFWWNGPHWLVKNFTEWPKPSHKVLELPEVKRASLVTNIAINVNNLVDASTYSDLSRLERIVAYLLRFTNNTRKTKQRVHSHLTVKELNDALNVLIKQSQRNDFSIEIHDLIKHNQLKTNSKITSFTPFLDEHGILRVGGRLQNSNFDVEKKHPAILSSRHPLAELIMRREHKRLLHVGPLGLLNATRNRVWIMGGRNLARKVVFKCVTCFRARPRNLEPLMGNLPKCRVTPTFPFLHTGIDYAGPIFLKTTNTRGSKQYKAYIAIFICMSTKAVHLELITSLTSDAFIAALRRFVSRRGRPRNMYSDNGTNFVGAQRELKEFYEFLKTEGRAIAEETLSQNIVWHFTPPRGPNFGGLWEAGVKSIKYHIQRTLNNKVLTYEDFNTLLLQIEAILNSRPLTPLSPDPNDFTPLTPAHFLIGRTLLEVANPNLDHLKENRMSNFQAIQSTMQHFWKRWSKEYINQLQQKQKWNKCTDNVKIDSLVLIADDNLPTMQWKLGRIIRLHPGKDGVNRVVTIKTMNGESKRPVRKICPLPIDF